MKKKNDTTNHYIDNKEFYNAMVDWKQVDIEFNNIMALYKNSICGKENRLVFT